MLVPEHQVQNSKKEKNKQPKHNTTKLEVNKQKLDSTQHTNCLEFIQVSKVVEKLLLEKCLTLQEVISCIDYLSLLVTRVGDPHFNPPSDFPDYFMQACKVYQMAADSISLNIELLSTNED